MLRTKFLPTVLVIVLGVNLGAWTLSVAMSPSSSVASLSVPVSSSAIDARSQAASVELTQSAIQNPDVNGTSLNATDTTATTSATSTED